VTTFVTTARPCHTAETGTFPRAGADFSCDKVAAWGAAAEVRKGMSHSGTSALEKPPRFRQRQGMSSEGGLMFEKAKARKAQRLAEGRARPG
jgi:hypothetical protein